MRKIIVAIAILTSTFLIGCECASSSEANKNHVVLEEVYHESWTDFSIIRDNETGVEYIYVDNGEYGGVAITPRLTKDKGDNND